MGREPKKGIRTRDMRLTDSALFGVVLNCRVQTNGDNRAQQTRIYHADPRTGRHKALPGSWVSARVSRKVAAPLDDERLRNRLPSEWIQRAQGRRGGGDCTSITARNQESQAPIPEPCGLGAGCLALLAPYAELGGWGGGRGRRIAG